MSGLPAGPLNVVPDQKPNGEAARKAETLASDVFQLAKLGGSSNRMHLLSRLSDAPGGVNAQDPEGNTVLMWAAEGGSSRTAQLLIDARADVNMQNHSDGDTALILAAKYPSVGERASVDSGALSGSRLTPPAGSAVGQVLGTPLELLVTAGADVNVKNKAGMTAIVEAARLRYNRDTKPLQVLIAAKSDVNSRDLLGNTVLWHAADAGFSEAVALLLEKRADPNLANNSGDTPLTWAAHSGNIQVLSQLIAAGADVNQQTTWGTTALMQVVQKFSLCSTSSTGPSVLDLLLQAKADVNATDNGRKTALMTAISNIAAVEKLLEAKADVAAADLQRDTALHHAARGGKAYVCELLLRGGADPRARNEQGKTPLEVTTAKDVKDLLTAGSPRSHHPPSS